MYESRPNRLQRFIYSHYFVSGMRRAAGVLLAFLLLSTVAGGGAGNGMIGALGAMCVAMIDQPGPLAQRLGTMLVGMLLAFLAVTLTGFASFHPLLLMTSVVGQVFVFSMLSVFGKRGAVVGTGCLILTIVTMHTPLTEDKVLEHTLITLAGAFFYFCFSALVSRPLLLREQEQCLSVALFSTANYIAARAQMYEPGTDLDESYRQLLLRQADVSDQHQAARDMIMRRLSQQTLEGQPRKLMVWNIFIDMINIMEVMVATHTDYTVLHRTLGQSDTLLFMRDALYKLSSEIERIAQGVTRERVEPKRNSVKAELLALEFEIERMEKSSFHLDEPETYTICIQVLQRLRKASRLVEHMQRQTEKRPDEKALNTQQLGTSMIAFLSRQSFRPGLLTSNLRMDSPTFRFSLRVSVAVALAISIGLLFPQLGPHGYWIVLTVIIIMKPAFTLTKQRNTARLVGTIGGCFLAFSIFMFVHDQKTLLILLGLSLTIGFSLIIVNYTFSTIFNTTSLMIALHLLLPSSYEFVATRAFDTLLGSVIAFICSYFLPWWEAKSLPSLARAASDANQAYLKAALTLMQDQNEGKAQGLLSSFTLPLAQRDALVAFSNFAQAFARMLGEPAAHQQHVSELNNLLIQNHVMAAQVSALLLQSKKLPQESRVLLVNGLQQLNQALADNNLPAASEPVVDPSLDATHLDWAYPLNQLQRAVQNIIRESNVIHIETAPA